MINEKFSKIGFVLAMAGSAVGLGNAWKFPTMVGNNGGSAFIILYLLLTFAIAFVAFLAELSIGKLGESDVVSSIYKLAPKHKKAWSFSGFFMIGAILIASFYMVVIGWILKYIYLGFSPLLSNQEEAVQQFNTLLSNDLSSAIVCFSLVFLMVFFAVSKGVKSGIEKLNIWMMPGLFILLICILFYAISMGDGFVKAAKFLFVPNFSAITPDVILQALGLAFFSLSMGVGVIPTYAANLPEQTNLIKSTLSIIFINILIGIMMGLVVFTFIFAYGADSTASGPGLIFISLVTLFAKLGIVGNVMAIAFFVSLLFAGVTSAVSMIEPFAYYLVRKFEISRKMALVYIGIFVYILGLFCIFSYYAQTANIFSIFGKPVFDALDFLTSNIMMPIGAIIFSFFVGYKLKKESLYLLFGEFMGKVFFEIWYFTLRYIVLIAICAIMIYQIVGE
ncbi:sodium-dependent transporter [Campylobacter concisus]|uniref:Sodium-dependent transporter n=1 Tax=Campylobacter concisus TaxID=199 RepID=A0A1Y5MSN1_9BACT|nr:sodium-dependent transporter [Campylobacter concisus]OUT11379.1 sodium-dependent transporter [Campylobacter concisus]